MKPDKSIKFLAILFLAAALWAGTPNAAMARCCPCDMTDNDVAAANQVINVMNARIQNRFQQLRQQIADFENRLITWLDNWWDEEFRPSLEDHAEHISTMLMEHARMMGSFFDAQNHVLVQMEIQKAKQEAGRRFRPHDAGCIAGTMVGGLPQAEAAWQNARLVLDLDNHARSAHHINHPSAAGTSRDLDIRWEQFTRDFCDEDQNERGMEPDTGAGGGGGPPTCTANIAPNCDVLVGEVLMSNLTINTEDELHCVMALERNLIEPFILNPLPESLLAGPKGKQTMLERRAVFARRQAAHDFVNTLIAKRMPGACPTGGGAPPAWCIRGGGQTYIEDMMDQLGLPLAEVSKNPSYNELMTVIMKRRFWDPEYFVRLQNDPENVAREQAILSAFSLMQARENYEIMESVSLLLATRLAGELD